MKATIPCDGSRCGRDIVVITSIFPIQRTRAWQTHQRVHQTGRIRSRSVTQKA